MRLVEKTLRAVVVLFALGDALNLGSGGVSRAGSKPKRPKMSMQGNMLSDSAAEKLGSNIGKGSNFKNFGATGLSNLGKSFEKGLDKGLSKLGKGLEKGLDKGLSKLGNGIGAGLEKGLSRIGNAFFVAAAALVLWTEVCVLKSFESSLVIQLLFSLVALKAVVFGIAAIGILFFTCIDAMQKMKKTNDSATPSTSAEAKM